MLQLALPGANPTTAASPTQQPLSRRSAAQRAPFALAALLCCLAALTPATAKAEKVIWQYDDLPGDMTVLADGLKKHPMSAHPGFVKFEAFGQIYKPKPSDYPVKILSVELVMAAPTAAAPPFAELPIAIEIYNDDAVAAAPSGKPVYSVTSADFFNAAAGKPGMHVQGNTGMIYEFDWSKPENHPPEITQGNIRVVIRILGDAGDTGEYWEPGCSTTGLGICQCMKQDLGLGLELCGCQKLAALTDSGTTPKANVLEIVYPLGACSGSKKWVWLEDVAKEGKQMKGDFLLRIGVDGVGGGGFDAGGSDDSSGSDSGGGVSDAGGGVDAAAAAKPVILVVSPNAGPGDKIVPIEIIGENFQTGAVVKVGSHKVAVDSVSASKIVGNVLSGIPPGNYAVIVENPNGQVGFKDPGYTVVAPPAPDVAVDAGSDSGAVTLGPLSLDLVDPNCVSAELDSKLTIFGSGFGPGLVLELGGVKLQAVSVETPSKATALLPKGMPRGAASLVASLDGKVASLANAVTVGCGTSGPPSSGCSAAPGAGGRAAAAGLLLLLAAGAALWLRRKVC